MRSIFSPSTTASPEIPLDVVGYLEGTLKSSVWVDILRHYERHFARFRDLDIEILEIGVQGGASLKVWQRYFTRAKFIGVDINPRCKSFEGDRVKIEIGSQNDPAFLATLARKYRPTIIIDDGSHLGHHIVYTFQRLFPILPPGGLYAIEDMFVHFGGAAQRWLGQATSPPAEYLFDVARLLFTEFPSPEQNHGDLAYLKSTVEEVAFAPLGVAFISKKPAPPNLNDLFAQGESYAKDADHSDVWERLAHFIQKNRGPNERALNAAIKAIEVGPDSSMAHRRVAQIAKECGKFDVATSSANKLTELEPAEARNWVLLGQVYFALGHYAKAETNFDRALTLEGANTATMKQLAEALAKQRKYDAAKVILSRALTLSDTADAKKSLQKELDAVTSQVS
jgi:hypothetical protein